MRGTKLLVVLDGRGKKYFVISQLSISSKHVQIETLAKVALLLKLPAVCPTSLVEACFSDSFSGVFFRLFLKAKTPFTVCSMNGQSQCHSSKFKKITK